MKWLKSNGAFVSETEHFTVTVYRRIGTSVTLPGWHFVICARPAEPEATARIWAGNPEQGYDDALYAICAAKERVEAMERGVRRGGAA